MQVSCPSTYLAAEKKGTSIHHLAAEKKGTTCTAKIEMHQIPLWIFEFNTDPYPNCAAKTQHYSNGQPVLQTKRGNRNKLTFKAPIMTAAGRGFT